MGCPLWARHGAGPRGPGQGLMEVGSWAWDQPAGSREAGWAAPAGGAALTVETPHSQAVG